jgi:hypothetical protein
MISANGVRKRRLVAEGGLLYSIVEERHLIGVETADALALQNKMHCAEQLVKALENKEINSCDGGHLTTEEVRVMPIGKDANAIVCFKCYEKEIKFQKIKKKQYGTIFTFPEWKDLKIYETS